uniref:Large ribosomal subunit protein uL23c n=1 Tax=Dipteris conjugata TaxID=32108 RepID=A0A385GPD7_9MONI|nr:ribosomal protein L23 [Dipteris conjugata]
MDKLINQILTEKTIPPLQRNQYTSDVNPESNKTEVKNWIEQLFNVKVRHMNSHRLPDRRRRGRASGSMHRKRMIITLHKNDSIPLFLSK